MTRYSPSLYCRAGVLVLVSCVTVFTALVAGHHSSAQYPMGSPSRAADAARDRVLDPPPDAGDSIHPLEYCAICFAQFHAVLYDVPTLAPAGSPPSTVNRKTDRPPLSSFFPQPPARGPPLL